MTGKTEERDLPHRSVLYHQIIEAIQPQAGGKYVDGTLGAGGHAEGILELSSPDGILLGLDVDPLALEIAGQRLSRFGNRAVLVRASYTSLAEQVSTQGWSSVDGIVLDLGASSMQFDTPERGFSFLHDGPLDMRFDPHAAFTASEIVNTWDQRSLADLLFTYGEERQSRRIARAICSNRPLRTTGELADLVARSIGREAESRIHPATRTFQALRIFVNKELENIENVLPAAIELLSPGGRVAVISFHSLEDRIVKNIFRERSKPLHDEAHPMAPEVRPAEVKPITKKPILPDDSEIVNNPRARSAKLRVVEKL